MVADDAHAVVSSEHEGGLAVVAVKVVEQRFRLAHDAVDDGNVVRVFAGKGPVGMTGGVQAEQVEEEDNLVAAKVGVQLGVLSSIMKQRFELIEDPCVKSGGVCRGTRSVKWMHICGPTYLW